MNDLRIRAYVDEIFSGVRPSVEVTEQKEELVTNLSERVRDYMRGGLAFDEAFNAAKDTVGDTGELTASFEQSDAGRQTPPEAFDYTALADKPAKRRFKIEFGWGIVALTPFIYVLVGLLLNQLWEFVPWFPHLFSWWAWGWVIIPASAILSSHMRWTTKLVSLSPFIYLLMGFWFGWWAWGWIIIPVAGLIEGGVIKVTAVAE